MIGAQSSGKFTLNIYFDVSSRQHQVDAEGMYFNICEFDDKIIWLIDTEGLLSLSAKHQFSITE